MQELLIANPRPKKRRKMSALQRKYFGKRRTTKSRSKARRVRVVRVSRNPRPVRRRRSPSRAVAVAAPRRRASRPRRLYARARSAGRSFSSRLGGTSKKLFGMIPSKIVPAMVGAGGALAVDMAWGYLPIPASLQTGPLAPVTRIGAILAMGYAAKFVAGETYAQEFTVGGLTVTMYDLAKTWMQANAPNLLAPSAAAPAATTGMYVSYYNPARFSPNSMGMYVGDYTADDYEEAY
jgi:hypothetical protein